MSFLREQQLKCSEEQFEDAEAYFSEHVGSSEEIKNMARIFSFVVNVTYPTILN